MKLAQRQRYIYTCTCTKICRRHRFVVSVSASHTVGREFASGLVKPQIIKNDAKCLPAERAGARSLAVRERRCTGRRMSPLRYDRTDGN